MDQIKNQLLLRIETSYGQLIEVVNQLTPAQFERQPKDGSWSAKDIMAHIAQWERVLLHFHIRGEDFNKVVEMEEVRYRQTPFDVINDHLHQTQRGQTASQIMQFARHTHSQLISALKALPAETLQATANHLAVQGYQAEALIHYIEAITFEHYEEHLDSLRQLAQQT